MNKPFKDIMAELPDDQREYVEKRGEEIYQEYITLKELRKVRELTQEHLAKVLNIKQESVSKLEKRSDIMLSTLRRYITAMGGELKLVVSLPGKQPYTLKGFEDFSAAEMNPAEDTVT